MKRNAFVIVVAAGVVALAAWQLAPAGAPDRSAKAAPAISTQSNVNTPVAAAGYVAHIDQGGRLAEEPLAGEGLAAALGQSINTSSEGLVEVASPVAGGGVQVDLQGRFQSSTAVTIDANGKITTPCLSNEGDVESFTSTGVAKQTEGKE
jgi:hypothetical protein